MAVLSDEYRRQALDERQAVQGGEKIIVGHGVG
jgi:hypothetical protein